jgi:hypothetical protein
MFVIPWLLQELIPDHAMEQIIILWEIMIFPNFREIGGNNCHII